MTHCSAGVKGLQLSSVCNNHLAALVVATLLIGAVRANEAITDVENDVEPDCEHGDLVIAKTRVDQCKEHAFARCLRHLIATAFKLSNN